MVLRPDSFQHIAKELSLFHVAVSTFYGSVCKVTILRAKLQAFCQFVLFSARLIVTLTSSKLLSLDNKNKK